MLGFSASDGSVYAIPQHSRGVLKITCDGDDVYVEQLDCGDSVCRYKEKFGKNFFTSSFLLNVSNYFYYTEGGVLCNGEIYCIPMRAKSAIKIIPGC